MGACFLLTHPDASEFRIGEKAEGNLPPGGHMVAAVDVVAHHVGIVNADVRKLRAACYFADGPNARRGGFQPFVDLDIAAIGELHAGQLQAQPFRIRSAARRNQQVTALDGFLYCVLFENDFHRLARFPRYALDAGVDQNVDPLVAEQLAKAVRHIVVFSIHHLFVAFEQRHVAAKATHGLG